MSQVPRPNSRSAAPVSTNGSVVQAWPSPAPRRCGRTARRRPRPRGPTVASRFALAPSALATRREAIAVAGQVGLHPGDQSQVGAMGGGVEGDQAAQQDRWLAQSGQQEAAMLAVAARRRRSLIASSSILNFSTLPGGIGPAPSSP